MVILTNQLELGRCPHCNVDKPSLNSNWQIETRSHSGQNHRHWRVYIYSRCGGLVTAASAAPAGQVTEIYPPANEIDGTIPNPAREYLTQAMSSLHASAGAVMLAASAVDAMLKEKGYKDGSLYRRINEAAAANLITNDMAIWAHEVRLEANDQRHADESSAIPNENDARRCVEFAVALGTILFVLPARVQRGIADATRRDGT